MLVCKETELRTAAFAIADGAALWSVPLDARQPVTEDATVSLSSAEPLVVQVEAGQERGTHAFLAFGVGGEPRGRIDFTGEYGEIQKDHAAKVVVTDDRLVAIAEYPYESYTRDQVVGFDLDTGKPVWREGFELDDAAALHAGGGRVTAVVERSGTKEMDEDLYVFDARTGEEGRPHLQRERRPRRPARAARAPGRPGDRGPLGRRGEPADGVRDVVKAAAAASPEQIGRGPADRCLGGGQGGGRGACAVGLGVRAGVDQSGEAAARCGARPHGRS